jgi:hypothetical protein
MDRRYTQWEDSWGPILRKQITRATPEEIDEFLLTVFEKIFDAAGCQRPNGYNGFPGDTAGSMPRGG